MKNAILGKGKKQNATAHYKKPKQPFPNHLAPPPLPTRPHLGKGPHSNGVIEEAGIWQNQLRHVGVNHNATRWTWDNEIEK